MQQHDLDEIVALRADVAQLREDIKPMIEMFSNIKWGERILIRIGVFLGGLVAFVLGIIEIIRLIVNFKK